MRKKTAAIMIAIVLLFQMLPLSALAATNYELYVGGKQFSSSNLSYTMGKGKAVYEPSTSTLTLTNADISINGDNTAVYSEIPGLNIVISGTVNINVVRTGPVNSEAVPFFGMLLCAGTIIKGNDSASTLNINSKNSYASLNSGSFTCYGIHAAQNSILFIENLKINATDNSDSAYAGKFSAICVRSWLQMKNCALTVRKAYAAIYDEFTLPEDSLINNMCLINVKLDVQCTGCGLYLYKGRMAFENLYGTISAPVGIYSYGKVNMKSTDKQSLTINATGKGIDCQNGKLMQESAILSITAPKGISLTKSTLEINGGKTEISFTSIGISSEDASSLVQFYLGEINLKGNGGADTVGINSVGSFDLVGTNTTITGVKCGIQAYTEKILLRSGNLSITASGVGYANGSEADLTIIGGTVTINAPIGIQLTKSKGGSFTLSGGTVTLNTNSKGLNFESGSGTVALNGGTLTVHCTDETKSVIGLYADSPFTVNGSTLHFTGSCYADMIVNDGKSSVQSGTLNLSSRNMGMRLADNFTVSGGTINFKGIGVGLCCMGGTYTFSGGKYSYEGDGYGIYCMGGTYHFSGGTIDLNADIYAIETDEDKTSTLIFEGTDTVLHSRSYSYALQIDGPDSSYSITGGSLKMSGTAGGANVMPSSAGTDYVVYAGKTEAEAKYIASPDLSSYTTNPFVALLNVPDVTLTIEMAQEGSTYTAKPGTPITYTAMTAFPGKHFCYWTLTQNGKTEKVSSDTVYTGCMPTYDAKLTAVYEKHTLSLTLYSDENYHWYQCSGCDYMEKSAHDFETLPITTVVVTEITKRCKVCGYTVTTTAEIETITVFPNSIALNSGESRQLILNVFPFNADTTSVTWESSDTGVAIVAADGTVTGVKRGTATITAKTSNGKTSTCTVLVDCEHTKTKIINKTSATCGKSGYTGDTLCEICMQTVEKGTVIPATGNHAWNDGEITTPASCSTDGVKTFTCSVCKGTRTETISATGNHAWNDGEITTPASCSTDGVKTFTCSVCKGTRTETISATGHKLIKTDAKTATETETGNNEYYTCSVCKRVFRDSMGMTETTIAQEIIPKLPVQVKYGDISGDGEVTAADARIALRASVKLDILNNEQTKAADVDGKSGVTAADARLILRYAVKLETKFPVES